MFLFHCIQIAHNFKDLDARSQGHGILSVVVVGMLGMIAMSAH